jgi:hypothetical protein
MDDRACRRRPVRECQWVRLGKGARRALERTMTIGMSRRWCANSIRESGTTTQRVSFAVEARAYIPSSAQRLVLGAALALSTPRFSTRTGSRRRTLAHKGGKIAARVVVGGATTIGVRFRGSIPVTDHRRWIYMRYPAALLMDQNAEGLGQCCTDRVPLDLAKATPGVEHWLL